MVSQKNVVVHLKRSLIVMGGFPLTLAVFNLLALARSMKHIFPVVFSIAVPIYLFMMYILIYFYKKQISFEENGIKIHRWGKRDDTYPYEQITRVEVAAMYGSSSVVIYQDKKKVAQYNNNYDNFMEALSLIKQRGIPISLNGDEVFDYVLPVSIPIHEAEEFGTKAFEYLRESHEKIYNARIQELHKDCSLHFKLVRGTGEYNYMFCAVYLMKNGSYTGLRSKKKTVIPGVLAVELVNNRKDRRGNRIPGELICNINYQNMLDGQRWRTFMDAIKNCEIIISEQKPDIRV